MGESHWSNHITEATLLARLPDRFLHLSVYGCSDNGQFCLVSPRINHGRISYRQGSKLNPHDIILEVHGYKVSGYTQNDLEDLIQTLSANCEPIIIKTIPGNLLTTSLKEYLGLSFRTDSLDQDLQRVIRDNVYLRVVPCTTRKPRDGEVNGVDYQFLSIDEFLELEKNDGLLESGMFEGNYYGTPKPSNKYTPPIPVDNSQASLTNNNNSASDTQSNDNIFHQQQPPMILNVDPDCPDEIDLGPLPDNWEVAYTEEGHQYFIDHNNGTTQWNDPRIPEDEELLPENYPDLEALNLDEPMPPGWEKVYDPKYGVFYIDHNNKRTQYEPPDLDLLQQPQSKTPTNTINSNNSNRVVAAVSEAQFTSDPSKLIGPLVRTSLIKSPQGFGFTIIGGSERTKPPEFLQIKQIMVGGAAALDGCLEIGDVLVYVDCTLVLGFLHSDIVQLFQHIQVGQQVTLTVAKGYALPYDLADPRARVVTTLAVANDSTNNISEAIQNHHIQQQIQQNNSEGGSITSSVKSSISAGAGSSSANDGSATGINNNSGLSNNTGNSKLLGKSQTEFIKVNIVKSSTGFGFTVSDSQRGQRVKQINDPTRCGRLREGDILVEINKVRVREKNHHEVVQILKDLSEGTEVALLVQRGSISAQSSSSSGYSSMCKTTLNNQSSPSLQQMPPKMSAISSTTPYQQQAQQLTQQNQQSSSSQIPYSSSTSTLSQSILQSRDVIDKQGLSDFAVAKYLSSQQHAEYATVNHNNQGQGQQKSRSRTPGPENNRKIINNNNNNNVAADLSNFYYNESPGPGDYSSVPRRPKTPTAADLRGVQTISTNNNSGNIQGSNTNFYWSNQTTQQIQFDSSGNTPNYIPASVFLEASSNNPRNNSLNNNDSAAIPHHIMYGSLSRNQSHKQQSSHPNATTTVHNKYLASNNTNAPIRALHLSDESSDDLSLGGGVGGGCLVGPQVFFVTLHKFDNGFGFRIIGGAEENTKITIGPLVPDGAAQRSYQVLEGDELVSVNGFGIVGATHRKVVQLVESAARLGSVTLGLCRSSKQQSNYSINKRNGPFDVTLTRDETEGFGFVIVTSMTRSGGNMGEFIGKLIDNSPAQKCNLLHVGDRILAVNGISVTKLRHEKIVQTIKNCGKTVKLRISPYVNNANQAANNSGGEMKPILEKDEEFDVVLLRGSHGYGFSIRNGGAYGVSGSGLVVLRVSPNGPADKDGRLQVGDELLFVNGRSTVGMGHSEAVHAIRAGSNNGGGGLLRLRVRRRHGHHGNGTGGRGPKIPPRIMSGGGSSANNRNSGGGGSTYYYSTSSIASSNNGAYRPVLPPNYITRSSNASSGKPPSKSSSRSSRSNNAKSKTTTVTRGSNIRIKVS